MQSFKRLDKGFWSIVLLDICFYLAFGLIMFVLSLAIASALNELKNVLPLLSKLQASLPDISVGLYPEKDIDAVLSSLKSAAIKTATAVLIASIVFFVLSTYFKGRIWSKTLKVKFDSLFYKKFLLLRFAWYLIWAILFLAMLFLIKREALAAYLIILAILLPYFTMIMLCLFKKENKIFYTIKRAFGMGIKKLYMLLVPYVLVYVAIYLAYLVLSPLLLISPVAFLILYIITIIIILAWFRVYVASLVMKIENKESFIL